MRKIFILILLLSLTALILPQSGRAEDEVQLETLDVNLWPEYDKPNMLVIYLISLQPQAETNELTFRIPKAAGKPFKVAARAEDDNLYEIDYQFQAGSEWGEVTFLATGVQFQLEYYDPGLVIQGSSRTFHFVWPGDFAVAAAAIHIQQPVDASQMQFSVGDVSNTRNVNDVLYYTLELGRLSRGEIYDFTLNYKKSTDKLTYEEQQVHSTGPLPVSMWSRRLPWAMGVLALVLIAGGVWVYWRSGQPEAGEKRRRKRKTAVQAASEVAAKDTGTYCHNCGRRAHPGDVFCRSCGTKLRI